MSQRLRSLLIGPLMNSEAKMYAFEQPNVEKLKTQTYEPNLYVLMCFLIATILWLAVCYLLYRLVRGFNYNSDSTQMDNYDALEESFDEDCDYTSSGTQESHSTKWQRLVRFACRKVGKTEKPSSHLQLIHVGSVSRSQSLPVLVNVSGS